MDWLKAGDRNTRFFHALTKNRRAWNCIQRHIDEEGKEWFEDHYLGRVAEGYFKKVFASEDVGMEIEDWNEIPSLVSRDQNEELLKEITEEEVRRAVFEINPNKCPGPDDMSGYFFQQF